jgi:predicted nucleic-acid-binding Zn-ribbon protein
MKCVACGSTNLLEGKILDETGSTKLSFIPRDVSMWKAAFGIDVREISALGCLHCGHLHLNVNFSDEDRHRFLEFDGQQPDLLNRIDSD